MWLVYFSVRKIRTKVVFLPNYMNISS